MTRSWGIVGGGVLGLTLALRLAEQGHEITLVDSADHIGGTASSWRAGDLAWDRHHHTMLASDNHHLALLGRLGLRREVAWRNARTAILAGGELHPFSSLPHILRFPPLRAIDRVRITGNLLYATRARDWRRLEALPATTWLRRWSGRRSFDSFWRPLLEARFGEAYRETSAAVIWATMQRFTAARGTGTAVRLGSIPGGHTRMLERFHTVLREHGVRFRLGSAAEQVGPAGGGLGVDVAGGERLRFDRVFVTAHAPIAARLCAGLAPDETARLESIRYLGVVCPSLLLKTAVPDFSITGITDPGLPFSAIISVPAPAGHTALYLPRYAAPTDPLFERSDAAIEDACISGLQEVFPHVNRGHIAGIGISRVPTHMPLPKLNYSGRVPRIETSIPGLYLAGSANIINGSHNLDETIRLADRAFELIS